MKMKKKCQALLQNAIPGLEVGDDKLVICTMQNPALNIHLRVYWTTICSSDWNNDKGSVYNLKFRD